MDDGVTRLVVCVQTWSSVLSYAISSNSSSSSKRCRRSSVAQRVKISCCQHSYAGSEQYSHTSWRKTNWYFYKWLVIPLGTLAFLRSTRFVPLLLNVFSCTHTHTYTWWQTGTDLCIRYRHITAKWLCMYIRRISVCFCSSSRRLRRH